MKRVLFCLAIFVGISGLAKASSLTCSPAPCVTSVVGFSNTASQHDAMEFAVASAGTTQIYVDSNYYNDLNTNGFCNYQASPLEESQFGSFASFDQGATWSGACVALNSTWISLRGDPRAVYDSSGNLYRANLAVDNSTPSNYTSLMYKSTNNGGAFGTPFSTWSFTSRSPSTCGTGFSTCPFDTGDYDYVTIDASDCLWVAMGEYSFFTDGASAIAVAKACSPYTSWTTTQVSALTPKPNEASLPSLVAFSNGHIVAMWNYCDVTGDSDADDCQSAAGGTTVAIHTSVNQSGTWNTASNPFDIEAGKDVQAGGCFGLTGAEYLPNNCLRTDVHLLPAATTGTNHGNNEAMFVAYHEWNGSNYQVKLRNATESSGTLTWSSATTLDSHSSDQIYPCVAVEPGNKGTNGTSLIGIAWLDTRNSPGMTPDSNYDAYGVVSKDGGNTWGTVYRMTSTSSITNVGGSDTVDPGEFLGDYTGCTWTNGIFYFVYPDTSSGNNHVGSIVGLNP